MQPDTSVAVVAWWATLSAISIGNIVWWTRRLWPRRRQAPWPVWLSAGFVFGCAFRSFLPRADVQRQCLVDSWLSTVLVGRSVATIAELCFIGLVALTLRARAREVGSRGAVLLSHLFVPLIVIAETCSWYAVITTNYLGNACEESLWTLTLSLAGVGFALLLGDADKARRPGSIAGVVTAVGYVSFMTNVDVPMYWHRYLADQAAGRRYLGFAEGLTDLASRWVVTFRWQDWHDELAWMGLYFTVAVWLSLFMATLLTKPTSPLRTDESSARTTSM